MLPLQLLSQFHECDHFVATGAVGKDQRPFQRLKIALKSSETSRTAEMCAYLR